MFFLFVIILHLLMCTVTFSISDWAESPGVLDLGLEAMQNRGFTPKKESVPSPAPSTLLMAGVALPDGDGGMSQGRQPMGTPGTGAGGLSRDGPEGRELAGSRCPDPGVTAATSASAGCRNSPQHQKMGVKPLYFPSPAGLCQTDAR